MYAYVFSTGLVDDSFSLVVTHPKKDLLPSSPLSGKIGIVIVEERDDSPNVFKMLLEKHNPCFEVHVYMSCALLIIIICRTLSWITSLSSQVMKSTKASIIVIMFLLDSLVSYNYTHKATPTQYIDSRVRLGQFLVDFLQF